MDSRNTFVQSLRDRLSNDDNDTIVEPQASSMTVEEHEFEELDERTQVAVNKMFETQRVAKAAAKSADDAFSTVRVKALQL